MNKNYFEILKKLEENGFSAYIVGGFVRDFLLGKKSKDVDIITNATPKELDKLFDNIIKEYRNYGAVKLKTYDNIIDITTFRKELSYIEGKPQKIKFIKSLKEDLKRRDFTINTLCMDKSGNIIDLLEGKTDIDNKLIKTVKDTYVSFSEDPSRILRAIRFMSILDFHLSDEIINYIRSNGKALSKINYFTRKHELDKIFSNIKTDTFFKFLKEEKLEYYLGINFQNIVLVNTSIGIWSQLEVDPHYPFTKREKQQIKCIKELLKKSYISKYDLYKNGLFICNVAADILSIDKKELNLIYANLTIKGIMDIEIIPKEICEILDIEPGEKLGKILKTIEYEIVEGLINNKKSDIINRVKELR